MRVVVGKWKIKRESIRNKDMTVKEPNNINGKWGLERRYWDAGRYKEMVSVCV